MNELNPNAEVENRAYGDGGGGARRLRRFTFRLVLTVREPTAKGILKRPEGRAPSTSLQPPSEFGLKHLLEQKNMQLRKDIAAKISNPQKEAM
jgi:hypothetical protein